MKLLATDMDGTFLRDENPTVKNLMIYISKC